jgi:hypothetical protein
LITGYNTDVTFLGTTYHVQTEDRRGDVPCAETLVYCGGRILDHLRTCYEGLLEEPYDDRDVAALLDRQHRETLRRVRQGQLATERLPILGDTLEDERDLAEVLVGALEDDGAVELLDLEAERRGGRLEVVVRQAEGGRAVEGARVYVRLVARGRAPVEGEEVETDASGRASLPIPEGPTGATLMVVAERGAGGARLRLEPLVAES